MQVQLSPEEVQEQTSEPLVPILDQLAREGVRRMLAAALELEVAESIAERAHLRGENGLRLVVRNGRGEPREIAIGGTAVPVQAPRVADRPEGEHVISRLLPPYLRRNHRLDQALPVLYLKAD